MTEVTLTHIGGPTVLLEVEGWRLLPTRPSTPPAGGTPSAGGRDHAPGVVARCPTCEQVLMRLVRDPGRAWLDLRGLSYLQLAIPDQN